MLKRDRLCRQYSSCKDGHDKNAVHEQFVTL